jgi:hypothetical protein
MKTQTENEGEPSTTVENYQPVIFIENYKGFRVRKSKKGYCAERIGGGMNLGSGPTVEDAVTSVDAHLEWQKEQEAKLAEAARQQAEREAERERKAQLRIEAVLACIEPVRRCVESYGLDMLRDCVKQLEYEEAERNVPANWEELVEKCEQIGECRCDGWGSDSPGDVDVNRHGVTESYGWNQELDCYAEEIHYGLQEYLDNFESSLEDDDENARGVDALT